MRSELHQFTGMLVAAKVSATTSCGCQRSGAAARVHGRGLRYHRPSLCKRASCPQQLLSSGRTNAASPEALNRALCDGSDWEEPAEGFNSIPEALTDLAQGKFVVVLDDESRENEGDLIMAAETMTTEAMAFMVEYTSGVICVPLEGRQVSQFYKVVHIDWIRSMHRIAACHKLFPCNIGLHLSCKFKGA